MCVNKSSRELGARCIRDSHVWEIATQTSSGSAYRPECFRNHIEVQRWEISPDPSQGGPSVQYADELAAIKEKPREALWPVEPPRVRENMRQCEKGTAPHEVYYVDEGRSPR
jgi:hypothetical protein